MKRYVLLFLTATLLLAGCAPFRYTQFTGQQVWPMAAKTMADTSHAVPVYRGWPEKPYTVLGSIQFQDPNAFWDEGDTARAARLAKKKNADAIIMRLGTETGVDAIVGAAADPGILATRQVAALVIRWKPESEIAAERAALERFAADFKSKHPDILLSPAVLRLSAELLDSEGLRLDSSEGSARMREIVDQVTAPCVDGKSTKWLFKGTLRSAALTSSFTRQTYGVATVTRTGDNIAIVSEPGVTGVHFSGTTKEGQLAGQMGVSLGTTIYSGKGDGVLSTEQISVSGQAQTADGLLQATFQFLR